MRVILLRARWGYIALHRVNAGQRVSCGKRCVACTRVTAWGLNILRQATGATCQQVTDMQRIDLQGYERTHLQYNYVDRTWPGAAETLYRLTRVHATQRSLRKDLHASSILVRPILNLYSTVRYALRSTASKLKSLLSVLNATHCAFGNSKLSTIS